MINIKDLIKIKDFCFTDILKKAVDKRNISVNFSQIGADYMQIIMSNGVQYARLVTKLNKMVSLPAISISWQDYEMITRLFSTDLSYTVQKNTIVFKSIDNKTKYSCQFYKGGYNEKCNFKFDFNSSDTKLLSTDNTIVIKQPKGSAFKCFVVKQNKLYSTDGSFGSINFLNSDIGDYELKLNTKLPEGNWYFNKDCKVIVSEDKSIAFTPDIVAAQFPTVALSQVAATNLSNYFRCKRNIFKSVISKLKDIDDRIYLDFEENSIVAHAMNDKANRCDIEFDVEFKQKPQINQIILNEKYIELLCQFSDSDNNLEIEFDDNPSQMLVRITTENLILFGMRCK